MAAPFGIGGPPWADRAPCANGYRLVSGKGDYTHLTGAGYRMIGDTLFEDLMAQYNRFLAIRAEGSHSQ